MAEEINTSDDWWEDLSELQKEHINEGIADAENNKAISAKEFWDKLRKQAPN